MEKQNSSEEFLKIITDDEPQDFDLEDDVDQFETVEITDDVFLEEPVEEFDEVPDDVEPFASDVVDKAKISFMRHTAPIFAAALSSNSLLAITGGQDDTAYVWKTSDGEVIFECTGHKDSVTEVGFSYNDRYVVSGDMGGLIQVWSVQEQKLVWCYENDDLEWMCWHNFANVLIAGCYSGDIYVWKVPQNNLKVLATSGATTTCGKVLPDGKHLVASYNDGQIKLWNLKSSSVVWQMSDSASGGVTALDITVDGSLLAVAPSSQVYKLSDGKLITSFQSESEQEIEAVTFNSELGLLATGSLTGKLCLWDVARKTLRHAAQLDSAVTVMKWGANAILFVGSTDGNVYVCDTKSGTLLETLTGHLADILSVTVFKDGYSVLSTSDDGTAKIFSVTLS